MKNVGQTDTTNYTLISLISLAGILGSLGGELAFRNWPPLKGFSWVAPSIVWGIIIFLVSYNEHRFRRRDFIVPVIFAVSDTAVMVILLASTHYYFNIPNLLTVISLGVGVYSFIKMCKAIHPFFHLGENLVYSDGSVLRQKGSQDDPDEEIGKRVVVRDFHKFKKEVLKTIPIEPPSGKEIPFSAAEAPPEPVNIGVEMETGFSSPEEMWAEMESIAKSQDPSLNQKREGAENYISKMDEDERKTRSEILWGSLQVTAESKDAIASANPSEDGAYYFPEDFRRQAEENEDEPEEYGLKDSEEDDPYRDGRYRREADIMSETSDNITENSPIAEMLEASGVDLSSIIIEHTEKEAVAEESPDMKTSEPTAVISPDLDFNKAEEMPLESIPPSIRKKSGSNRAASLEDGPCIPLEIIREPVLSEQRQPEEEQGALEYIPVVVKKSQRKPIPLPSADKANPNAVFEKTDKSAGAPPVVIKKIKPISAGEIFGTPREKAPAPFIMRNPGKNDEPSVKPTENTSRYSAGKSGAEALPVIKTLEGMGKMKPVRSSELFTKKTPPGLPDKK